MANEDVIPDNQLTAQSQYSNFAARFGRLHGTSAWCPSHYGKRHWFQVDLGKVYEVCAVATQGKAGEWTTLFTLSTSLDGVTFTDYMEANQVKVNRPNSKNRSGKIIILVQLLIT